MERHRERAEIFHFRLLTRFSIPSDFLLAVLATDGVDDYQGGIAPCRLARTTADAKTLKLETEQVASFSHSGYSILPNDRCHPIAAF